MPRDSKVYLEDILEAAQKIRLYTEGLSFEAFCGDGGLAMATDPIVDEIHAIREEIARQHDYNLDAIVETLQKASAQSGRRVVTLPSRPVVKP